jgi:hypothetical protein
MKFNNFKSIQQCTCLQIEYLKNMIEFYIFIFLATIASCNKVQRDFYFKKKKVISKEIQSIENENVKIISTMIILHIKKIYI